MTRLVKPNHYQSVDEQRHRRGPHDGLGRRLAGSSKPKNCLQFSKVHSMAQRQA